MSWIKSRASLIKSRVGPTPSPTTTGRLESNRHIRMLVLHPGERQSTIKCSLEHLHIDDPRAVYEALSYVWGPPDPARSLICDGRTVQIGPNLHTALTYLRHRDKPRNLWVDAVCINQADVPERNSQVLLMRDIYYEAGRVTIWLGEADEHTKEGIETLQELEQRLAEAKGGGRLDFDKPGYNRNEAIKSWDIESEESLPLKSVLSRAYFSRIWVLRRWPWLVLLPYMLERTSSLGRPSQTRRCIWQWLRATKQVSTLPR